jgi:transposase
MAIVTVGIDLAKNVFAVHGVDETGKAVLVRPEVPRAKLMAPKFVVPYRMSGKRGKNDANDGAAIFVVAQSTKALRAALSEVLEDGSNEMSGLARLSIERAQDQWRELDEHMNWCDKRIAAHVHDEPRAHAAAQLLGVGLVTASATDPVPDWWRPRRTNGTSPSGSYLGPQFM